MTVITLTSAKGSPGVSTTALAMALIWPRPCLLVEADMAGSSSVLAGYFQGQMRHDRGLIDLADAFRRDDLTDGLRHASIPLPNSTARVLPGLRTTAQAGTMARLWEPIASALRGLERSGIDVIVDAGRMSTIGAPAPVLRESDLALLLTRSNMPALAATRAAAGGLREEMINRGSGEDALVAVMVGEGQPYPSREASSIIRIPVIASVDWDPVNAEVISLGKEAPKRFQGSRFVRSTTALVSTVEQHIRDRRDRLAPGALLSVKES